MLRLLFFIAATLAGLFFLALAYDAGGAANSNQITKDKAGSATQEAKELIQEIVAAPESNGAEGAPPADLVEAEAQTPEKVQNFPGPDLRPSPEYADQTTTPPSQVQDGEIFYVTAEKVNFRAGPSTSDPVLGGLSAGDVVEALGSADGDWVNIRDAEGRIGYMSGQFLSAQAPN